MKIIRSIVSAGMAMLVLLASSSFYLSTHSCGGRINAIAFLHEADGCGHAQLPPCHQKLMKGCCENEIIAHDAQEIKGEASLHVLPLLPSFEFTFTPVVVATLIPEAEPQRVKFFNYDIPLPVTDLTVAYRSLLI